MPYNLPKHYTTRDLRHARQKHADYQRQRKMPYKECRICKKVYDNNHQNFQAGKGGWLTHTCVNCVHPETSNRMLMGACCSCGQKRLLLRDKEGAEPVRVCRRCFSMAQRILEFTKAEQYQFLKYINWRRGWPGPNGEEWLPRDQTFPIEAHRNHIPKSIAGLTSGIYEDPDPPDDDPELGYDDPNA